MAEVHLLAQYKDQRARIRERREYAQAQAELVRILATQESFFESDDEAGFYESLHLEFERLGYEYLNQLSHKLGKIFLQLGECARERSRLAEKEIMLVDQLCSYEE